MTALLTLLVIAAGVWIGGRVEGSEFSPSDFSVREFQFYEVPILHTQITPIKRTKRTLDLPRYLAAQSLIDPAKKDPPIWHLASIGRAGTALENADAALLVDQFELAVNGQEFWRTWSEDHPAAAGVLWSVIQDLAYEELYVLVPDVFDVALNQSEPNLLREALKKRLKKEIENLIEYTELSQNEAFSQRLSEKLQSTWFENLGTPVKKADEAERTQTNSNTPDQKTVGDTP